MNAEQIFPARIGLGTWKMGERSNARAAEVDAVTHALNIGYRLIDTAEMYANGGAEKVVGAALQAFGRQRRAELCIVSKVLPNNASRRGTVTACEASLRRLDCEYLDLYLLHWSGNHSFVDTLQAFVELRERGLIRRFGVSNLDVNELAAWRAAEQALGLQEQAGVNQVYYSLAARGIEFDLLPWQREHDLVTMAYSPLALGDLATHPVLQQIAAARGATAAQIALAWVIRHRDVVAIPKSSRPERLEENFRARELTLTGEELTRIDAAFPVPKRKRVLAMV